jgi:SpoVK/Ycf46/Vps4 family AAA+-type ATPase
MVKRKIEDDDESYEDESSDKTLKTFKRNVKPKIKLENCPNVNNLNDLIEIGKTNKFYKNINTIMLWDILQNLIELQNMIGMNGLKETIFYQIIYYLQNMHKKNKNEEYLHTIIMGSPGCGKTSVAKIIGNMYKNMGILSRDGVFKIGYRDDFVGEYLGQTAVKTRKMLESCLGGVLFIDEVYSLGPGQKDKDSFSKEAIDTICSYLSEHKNDFCCIIAGYEKEIKNCFLAVNSGLERRFPWVHVIDEYNEENLADIFIKLMTEINWTLHKNVDTNFLINFFRTEKEYFKNFGGDIETFITKIKMFHSKRVFILDKEHKFIITKDDVNGGLEMVKKYRLNKEQKKVCFGMYT